MTEDNRSILLKEATPVRLTFANNRLFVELCGEFNKNLALIEQSLAVDISSRGNQLYLSGDDFTVARATAFLKKLYKRLEAGETIDSNDLKGLLTWFKSLDDNEAVQARNQGFARITTRAKIITARTKTQDNYIKDLQRYDMVFATGPAGTGKTYVAVVYALSLLEARKIKRIILSRPAVEAGERLGFLPGDMREKIDPYLRPLYDALHDVLSADQIGQAMQAGIIEIAPLAFMRGRTLDNAIIILDEAQNCSLSQMKMFLTRLGNDSKMVITGDPSQIDLTLRTDSGLLQALSKLKNIDDISFIEFGDQDIVRHSLVTKIVRAYDKPSP